MKKQNKAVKFIEDYFIITLASVLYSVGFCWFYQPNGISVGGFTGISQILNYLVLRLIIADQETLSLLLQSIVPLFHY